MQAFVQLENLNDFLSEFKETITWLRSEQSRVKKDKSSFNNGKLNTMLSQLREKAEPIKLR